MKDRQHELSEGNAAVVEPKLASVVPEHNPANDESKFVSSSTDDELWQALASTHLKIGIYSNFGKRFFDLVLGCLLVAVLMPVLVVVACIVRVKLGPGIFYRQKRIGLHGRTFEILKFRTMLLDRRAGSLPVASERRISGHKSEADPRHTRLGKLIRKLGFDELPQLLNVIRGEMSLVGPRPELVTVAKARGYVFHARHLTRPGLTGIFQLSQLRQSGDLRKGLAMDTYYVRNMSFLGDSAYIVKSPAVVMAGFFR